MKKSCFLVLGIAAILGGLSMRTVAGPEADAGKLLAKLDDDWSKTAEKKDLEGLISFYAEDAIIYPPNHPVAIGREGAKKVWGALFAIPTASISWKAKHSEVSKSGDIGFTAGTYELSFKGPDGKPVTEKGKTLCVWKLQKDGSWKAAHDMWNSDAK